MPTGDTSAERMLLEADFRERRRRVLRAEAAVLGAFALGLLFVFAAKTATPQYLHASIAVFLVLLYGSMLRVWRIARRHWRCPACDVRWMTGETLASFQWNHCPSCGEALRAHPHERDRDRIAHAAFALERLPVEVLRERAARRRHRALWWVGLVIVLGLGVLVRVQPLAGEGEWLGRAVVVGFGSVVAGLLVWGARCPRCRTGVLAPGRHCMRCGLQLEPRP